MSHNSRRVSIVLNSGCFLILPNNLNTRFQRDAFPVYTGTNKQCIALFCCFKSLFILTRGRNNPQVQAQLDLASSISHSVVERFGLLAIIVLGEVIAGVVRGITGHHHLNWLVGATAALGMLIAIGIWWVYFDFLS